MHHRKWQQFKLPSTSNIIFTKRFKNINEEMLEDGAKFFRIPILFP